MKFTYPYSSSADNNKVIFVHTPKTAGKGIAKALFKEDFIGHHLLEQYKKTDVEKYNSYYKFGFVRNPWDRLVSAYFYLKQGNTGPYGDRFTEKYLTHESFEEFVYDLSKRKDIFLKWVHFIPQFKFVCDENNKVAVDYIGKYETLEEDFKVLRDHFKVSGATLEKFNNSKHKPYWEYYNKEMVEIVRCVYQDDINIFNYEFPYEKLK